MSARGCHGLVAIALLTFGLGPVASASGFPSTDSRPAARSREGGAPRAEYAAGQVLVTLRPGRAPAELRALAGGAPSRFRHEQEFGRLSALRGRAIVSLSVPGKSTRELLAACAADPAVERVEPNRRFTLFDLPDDPHLPRQWALDNQGQALHGRIGLPDADIDAPEAWAALPPLPETVVAVLDSGIDATHQDLAPAMWVNPGEVAGNGLDDDGNGWADDVHGANMVWPGGADTADRDGHGSHVAGIIAARTGEGTGMAGVAPNARLMAVRAFSRGTGYTDDIVAGLLYILDMKVRRGVNVVAVNGSFGGWGGGDGDLMSEVIESLGEAGVVFVAAAGNDGLDMDRPGGYLNLPAGYASPAIVAVAATDSRDELPSWSSRGQTSVDLAAPGAAILSSIPGGADRSIFFDDLEAGLGNWEHGGTNDYWGLTGEDAWSGTGAAADSPGELFLPGSDSFLALNRDLDLSGRTGEDVRISFFARTSLYSGGNPPDALLVEASGNGGGDWVQIAPRITGQASGWKSWQAVVPAALATAAFRFRFRLSTVSTRHNLDGVILDDIAVGVHGGATGYAEWSGTSMAAPHVAGAIALLAGRFPGDDIATRVDRLLSGTDRLPGLGGRVLAAGRLNLARSLDPNLPLRPRLAAVSPREGTREGTTVVLDGKHFGADAGRVLVADAPWPGWGEGGGLRFRFHLVDSRPPGSIDSWTNAWIDDVSLAAGGLDLFADDLEQGAGDWVHGGVGDSWALSAENAHSPTLAWSDSPAIGATGGGDSWLMPDRSFDGGAAGADFPTLGFWNQLELNEAALSVEVADGGGSVWNTLADVPSSNTGFLTPTVWMRYGLPVPRAPIAAAVDSWSDTAVTLRLPAGAGRFLQVVRADGEASNLLAASGWAAERPPSRTRVAAAAAALGGRIYLAGGQVDYSDLEPPPDDARTAALEVFDPEKGWRRGPPMAHLRAAPAAAVAGGRVYVIGGSGMVPSGYDDELFSARVGYIEAFDPETGKWKTRAPLPEPAEALAAAAVGTTIYVTGGYGNDADRGSLGSLWAFDTVANRWARRAPMLVPRAWHAMAAVGGKLYVFGGSDGKGGLLDSAECYDPGTDSWSRLPDLPFARFAMAGTAEGGLIRLTGGRDAVGRFTYLSFDPATQRYDDRDLALEHPPVSRGAHNLVWVPGRGLYALGGIDSGGWLWAPGMEMLPDAPSRAFGVLSPAAGEPVASGSSTVVAWQGRKGAHHYALDLSVNGGRSWRRLAASVRGTTWRWQVPRPLRSLPRCRVRVTAFDAAGARLGSVMSRSPFSVDLLTVPVPCYLGAAADRPANVIVWDTHGTRRPAESAEVAFSRDGGASWETLATLEGNPGLCPWQEYPFASLDEGEVGRVRVRLRDARGIVAEGVSPRFTSTRF